MVFDATDLTVVDANRGALTVFGSTMADTLGRPITDWMVGMDGTGLAAMVGAHRPRRGRGPNVGAGLSPLRRRTVPMEILLQVAELEDGTSGVLAVARDIARPDRIAGRASSGSPRPSTHARQS